MPTLKYKYIHVILAVFMSIFMLYGNTTTLKNQIFKIENIPHLYFNTLIAFPQKAFSQNNPNKQYFDNEKITPYEFENILKELHKNNFILISPHYLLDTNNNEITQQKVSIPDNKKPIIFSFDNVTYKSNYQTSGEVNKIIVDRNNNIATYSSKQSIQDRISYNNEFITILETFILNNPDFVYKNSRGIIFCTGINGLFGYNTSKQNPSSRNETKRVKEVVLKLKSLGWEFGCNNYEYISPSTQTQLELSRNLSLWKNEIQPIIESSSYFAYPNTSNINTTENYHTTLVDNNFKIFFNNNTTVVDKKQLILPRTHISGSTLRNNKAELSQFFNCELVYDHINRPTPLTPLNQ